MYAPPRKKKGCPAPPKIGLASPRSAKLTKFVGRSGPKLAADSIDTPIHYACQWCIKGRKSRKIFSFFFFYILWLSSSQKCLFKVSGDNVFINQYIIIHEKYLHNNLRTFVELLGQSIYAFFCPAPPRWKKLCPAHPWFLPLRKTFYVNLRSPICL